MAGPIKTDRIKGANVRRLILSEVERLFEKEPETLSADEATLKRELLLRMAPNTIPRLTEVTGEGGGPIRTISQLIKELDGTGTTESEVEGVES